MKRWLPTAIAVVVVDQLTKWWARRDLGDYRVIDLPGPGALRLSYNTGVAFGQGRGWGIGPIIAALGMVIIGILVLRVARHASPGRQLIVGLVIGGAVGNLIDRVVLAPGWFRGPVTDFIQLVPWFPIFNVADMAITLGGIALVLAMTGDTTPTNGKGADTPDDDLDPSHPDPSQPDPDEPDPDETGLAEVEVDATDPEERATGNLNDAADDSESAER